MKQQWKVIGITALVAGVLAYPAYKLIKYLSSRMDVDKDKSDGDHHVVKAFIPAFRGRKHKPHHDHN